MTLKECVAKELEGYCEFSDYAEVVVRVEVKDKENLKDQERRPRFSVPVLALTFLAHQSYVMPSLRGFLFPICAFSFILVEQL